MLPGPVRTLGGVAGSPPGPREVRQRGRTEGTTVRRAAGSHERGRVSRILSGLGVVVVLAGTMAFAALNSGARVTLDLGITTLYRIPVVYVAVGGLLTGMLIMLVAGIRSDLKVRRILRERLREEDRTERARIDRYQQDLFQQDPDESS